jgi:aspartate dehydrogenase
MRKITIVGCGTIGAEIARYIDSDFIDNAYLFSVVDLSLNKLLNLKKILKRSNPVFKTTVDSTLKKTDIIIECASHEAVRQIIYEKAVSKKKLLILSTGALLVFPDLIAKAKKKRLQLFLPSGAIAGIDGVKAAKLGRIDKVILTTRKNPISLGIKRNISAPRVVFQGTAHAAIKLFPANINVAATLSLSGIGPKKTFVKIIADPSVKFNIHEIQVKGNFGSIITKTENMPSKNNPRTSYLAILSAVQQLQEICGGQHGQT